ncbi:acyltransferase family protein [Xanthocytophaga agilis]|uniref:Acyltransferase family protein n=1 Tax=Xanthocytophaga agilis TaxID=3048010 RepID=A0AAE3RAH4_9BACT|nr:acyltransferase family protein [Xanthocytophaga agilis]MDJ1503738.1 acyltransferase family protein [Xanthocytophaga agilis]
MNSRQVYLDWLRIFAIIGMLFFHSAMAFVAEEGWHIKNKDTSNLLLEFNFWLSRFRMPLLFFISGAVAWWIMESKTVSSFIGLRFRRLFLPLVFGILVVVPPQIYMERLTQGFKGNFWDFYPTMFSGNVYPKGNISWHHLWFVAYLFVYDVMLAPFFGWCKRPAGKRFLQKLNWFASGLRIYWLTVPVIVLFSLYCIDYPQTHDLIHDPCYFVYWLFFLLVGYLCMANPVLLGSLERNRRLSLTLAFLSIVSINYLRWNELEPFDLLPGWRADVRTYLYLALYPFTAWTWVFAIIGYGKRYLNKPNAALNYLNEAAYPFYILHQTVIIVIVYYVVQTTDTIGSKFLFTSFVSLLICMLIYHTLIRPFGWMRFLFGMKPQKLSSKEPVQTRQLAEAD